MPYRNNARRGNLIEILQIHSDKRGRYNMRVYFLKRLFETRSIAIFIHRIYPFKNMPRFFASNKSGKRPFLGNVMRGNGLGGKRHKRGKVMMRKAGKTTRVYRRPYNAWPQNLRNGMKPNDIWTKHFDAAAKLFCHIKIVRCHKKHAQKANDFMRRFLQPKGLYGKTGFFQEIFCVLHAFLRSAHFYIQIIADKQYCLGVFGKYGTHMLQPFLFGKIGGNCIGEFLFVYVIGGSFLKNRAKFFRHAFRIVIYSVLRKHKGLQPTFVWGDYRHFNPCGSESGESERF